jgi:hypothetical protein
LAQLVIHNKGISVKLTFAEKIWSISGDFEIPVTSIRGAEVFFKELTGQCAWERLCQVFITLVDFSAKAEPIFWWFALENRRFS